MNTLRPESLSPRGGSARSRSVTRRIRGDDDEYNKQNPRRFARSRIKRGERMRNQVAETALFHILISKSLASLRFSNIQLMYSECVVSCKTYCLDYFQ